MMKRLFYFLSTSDFDTCILGKVGFLYISHQKPLSSHDKKFTLVLSPSMVLGSDRGGIVKFVIAAVLGITKKKGSTFFLNIF